MGLRWWTNNHDTVTRTKRQTRRTQDLDTIQHNAMFHCGQAIDALEQVIADMQDLGGATTDLLRLQVMVHDVRALRATVQEERGEHTCCAVCHRHAAVTTGLYTDIPLCQTCFDDDPEPRVDE